MEDRARVPGGLLYGWLFFAVFSLVFAGIFALLVAMARTPGVEDLLPLGRDYIYVALVGHVILAVVIWFLAFEGFLWTLTSTVHTGSDLYSPLAGWLSLGLSFTGTIFIVITAVFGLGYPELANYVPVLLHPLFYAGLGLIGVGMVICLLNTFVTVAGAVRRGKRLPTLTFGMTVAGICVLTAFVCFLLSGYFQIATGKGFFDFERFFWGGGHILQFANTTAMVTAWIYLSRTTLGEEPVGGWYARGLYLFYLLFVLPSPVIYFIHDTSTQSYKDSFTWLMQWGLGPSTAVFILCTTVVMFSYRGTGRRLPWTEPGFSSLLLSMAIFVLGGFIAVMIRGVNTIIPAHYHCVIGAVTIAFMGVFYEILPMVGRSLYLKRLAKIQPYLYTLGIVLFAVGLFIAGSHGVARKTYGAEQNLDSMAKFIGMSIMGVGGLVAILGGIAFVINALISLLRREG